jgi:L-threonylcarbamoyladenylate synthase
MILYPTETLYALGVNALDETELKKLSVLKDRAARHIDRWSWLVRNMEDVEKYAYVTKNVLKVTTAFLPGKLTLVLQAKDTVPLFRRKYDNEISFRISSDRVAQKVIEDFMAEYDAPLTCTSANVSGLATLPTVGEILQQFGPQAKMITQIVDDGPRKGLASTIVRIIDDEITVLREGDISEAEIRRAVLL